jgi:hypothetical protein
MNGALSNGKTKHVKIFRDSPRPMWTVTALFKFRLRTPDEILPIWFQMRYFGMSDRELRNSFPQLASSVV